MIVGLTCLCSFSSASAEEAIPTGNLNVDRTLVRAGSKSNLDWKIQHPSELRASQMRVRVLGSSFQVYRGNNGGGNNADEVDSSNHNTQKGGTYDPSGTYDDENRLGKPIPLPIEVKWQLNNSSWIRLFQGTQADINPLTVVLNTTINPNDVINFGARGYRDNAWLPFYSTATATPNVVTLENGDSLPSIIMQRPIESILKPYITADNKIQIGIHDLLILVEVGQADPNLADFNLQDVAILVTFE